MIATQPARQERVYGPIDYLLTGVYACLAAYATGISVGSSASAWMFVGIIAAGTLFSFTVQWLIGDQPVVKYDGLLYMAVGLAVFFFREDLGKMAPDQPFQDQLVLTGTFTWLLALGSFFTWRDGTLLFQAVPSIALFGMVGIFDTFKAVPFLFFALLVCLATLFARAHRRQMIEQAEASGYKAMLAKEEAAEAMASGSSHAPGGARLEAILQGPWKWMAGPEWALASALVIVMVSLLGAPVLRLATKPIAGSIHIPPPPLTGTQAAALLGHTDSGRVFIGLGPVNLTDRIVLQAQMDEKRYLRVRWYNDYNKLGWEIGNPNTAITGALGANAAENKAEWIRSVEEIKQPIRVPFRVTLIDSTLGGIPVPGEIDKPSDIHADNGSDVRPLRTPDGSFVAEQPTGNEVTPPFSGVATVSSDTAVPKQAVKADELPQGMLDEISTDGIPQSVIDKAKELTKDQKTDYDKAMAIKHYIEQTCKYNLKTPRSPANVDPVENFLFVSKQGYCDLFASSMTLMARAAGIPARYVTGFYPTKDHYDAPTKSYLISEAEAHAWSELFFKDVGWVPFDATEGAIGVGDPTVGKAWYKSSWAENALNGSILFVLIGGGFYAYLMFKKSARDHIPSRDDVGKEYARFVSLLQKASGRRRVPSQTPAEYLAISAKALGDHSDEAQRLTRKFEEALYSPAEIHEGILKELRQETDKLKRDIKAERQKNGSLVGSKK